MCCKSKKERGIIMTFAELTAQITTYAPRDAGERADRHALLRALCAFGPQSLDRACPAHLTGSGFIVNPSRTRALFIRHALRQTLSWTGGHADGESDLLSVALREAREETGCGDVRPLSPDIASLELFAVPAHLKNGAYVSAHLHLSVAFLLVLAEDAPLCPQAGETDGAVWLSEKQIAQPSFSAADAALYQKLFQRARRIP